MKCEEFERLLPGKLGGELEPDQLARFERHLASCKPCHREYESLRSVLDAMKQLADLPGGAGQTPGESTIPYVRRAAHTRRRRLFRPGVLRVAASVLIAFTAGYATHAGLMLSRVIQPVDSRALRPSGEDDGTSVDLHTLVLRTYQDEPSRSDLARALIVTAPKGR